MNDSLASVLSKLPDREYEEALRRFRGMSSEDLSTLLYDWSFWGRAEQQEPIDCRNPLCGCEGNYSIWLYLAGRGAGKSRTGSEWARRNAWRYPGCRIAIIAPTAGDARDVMIEGESGILATSPPWFLPDYEPSKRRLTWPNGSIAGVFSADEPRRLRGPQHHFVWCDELASWPDAEMMYAMAKFGLRLPARPGWPKFQPRMFITTTPLPIDIIRRIVGVGRNPKTGEPNVRSRSTHITTGSTYDNRDNLDPTFFETVISEYEGTRLGQQELHAKILDDVPGAMWKAEMIDPLRVSPESLPEDLSVVVSVDPSTVSNGRGSIKELQGKALSRKDGTNLTGIVVCASGPYYGVAADNVVENHAAVRAGLLKNQRRHGYVLADWSIKGTPDQWARRAVHAYHEFGADAIVAESNQGGDMVRYTIHSVDGNVPVKLVQATKSKKIRAEPIVALYEQRRIHHVGSHPLLEEQMLTWDPELSASPDRLDALVWGLTHLLGKGKVVTHAAGIGVGARVNPWSIYT